MCQPDFRLFVTIKYRGVCKVEKLYKKLKQYSTTDYYPYHMPGHKRRMFGELPEEIIETDITEIDGFDNLHQSEGIL